jgi:transketolase
MRALPNMTVVVPADADATASVIEQSLAIEGPVYVRLGRKTTAPLPEGTKPAAIGQIQPLRDGDDVVFVCCGPHPVHAALGAAQELEATGISAAVLNAHTLSPFDHDALVGYTAKAALVVTVEEHRLRGGLGGLVAETLAERAPHACGRLRRFGMPDVPSPGAGSQDQILERHGLGATDIAVQVRAALRGDPGGRPPEPAPRRRGSEPAQVTEPLAWSRQ